MSDSITAFLSLVKPEEFSSEDTWGGKLNTDWDDVDAAIQSLVETRNYAAGGGTADVITVTLDPAPLSLVDGLEVRFKASGNNTVAPTLNVNALGATAIKYPDASSLAAGALVSGVIYTVTYNSSLSAFVIGAAAASAATAAETLTGTDLAKFLTAGGFAGNKSLSANGYYKFPGGFTVQWGATSTSITSESDHSVTFPVAFATACGAVMAMANNPTGASNVDGFPQLKSMTTSGATFRMQDVANTIVGVTWIAVGY